MNPRDYPLGQLVEQYVVKQRALGREYHYEQITLVSLGRFLSMQSAVDLDSIQFDAWCRSLSAICINHRRKRQLIVRKFCLYRQRTEPACFVPDIHRFPHPVDCRPPAIFGEPEAPSTRSRSSATSPCCPNTFAALPRRHWKESISAAPSTFRSPTMWIGSCRAS